ncbi:hypothetical protein [Synechocystis sp. PCC 7509]|uniref:hypothetical protein n=1 Tax=Synechocystis sp. PCC 7509 TaxID=927677 RepID=UPI0002ABE6A7|nr:hypothetical protein [Synechocystis sp. PCC 7509]
MKELKEIIKGRMEELEISPYHLAIAYGKIIDPDNRKTERDIGNRYLSTVNKAIEHPETCKNHTLKTLIQALEGELVLCVEFVDKKVYRL